MTDTKAKVVGINGNMITIEFDGNVSMNEVGYVNVDGKKLRGEVIRIRGNKAQMQIFEMTQGIKAGDTVELAGDLLCADVPQFLQRRPADDGESGALHRRVGLRGLCPAQHRAEYAGAVSGDSAERLRPV